MLGRAGVWIAREPVAAAAATIAAAATATILGAFVFQYGLGLAPCPLCLQQRWPYYLTIPLTVLTAVGARRGAPRRVLVGSLVVVALVLVWGAYLGLYHAGAEWKWWAGPQDCVGAGFAAGPTGNLLQQMQNARVVRCDEAPWRLLGLSLAGWNVVIALALATTAVAGIVASGRAPYGSSSVSQYK